MAISKLRSTAISPTCGAPLAEGGAPALPKFTPDRARVPLDRTAKRNLQTRRGKLLAFQRTLGTRQPTRFLILPLLLVCAALGARAEDIVPVGSGSYTTKFPAGAKAPPATIYRTANVKGPMPTNDWWSSLAWVPFSDSMYPHPLAMRAVAGGLRVAYPGDSPLNVTFSDGVSVPCPPRSFGVK